MPQADVDGLSINYGVQGEGEPLVLVPYLAADHACYAFQLPAYSDRGLISSSARSIRPQGPSISLPVPRNKATIAKPDVLLSQPARRGAVPGPRDGWAGAGCSADRTAD
jgi:hypothetical protein